MTLKLDAYDKKILEELLNNSRQSTTTLSKKVKLSRENVDYKIKKLIKEKIIKEFITEFDEPYLKIKHHILFAQLTRLTKNTEQELLNYLKNNKYISWLGTAAGKWTLICDVYVPEQITLSEVMKDILNNYGTNIEEYMLLELTDGEYFFEKILDKEKNMIKKKTKETKIDKTDHKIMQLLNINSRINYAELSTKLKMSANGIKNRIKNLEKNNIIKKYSIIIDYKKFDYDWYGIQIKITKFDTDTVNKINQYLKHHKKTIFYYKYIGAWDYDVGLLGKSSSELRDFINEIRTKFPEDIKITDVFITLDEIKGYHLPEGVFELK